jgi:hypothetical protein
MIQIFLLHKLLGNSKIPLQIFKNQDRRKVFVKAILLSLLMLRKVKLIIKLLRIVKASLNKN